MQPLQLHYKNVSLLCAIVLYCKHQQHNKRVFSSFFRQFHSSSQFLFWYQWELKSLADSIPFYNDLITAFALANIYTVACSRSLAIGNICCINEKKVKSHCASFKCEQIIQCAVFALFIQFDVHFAVFFCFLHRSFLHNCTMY